MVHSRDPSCPSAFRPCQLLLVFLPHPFGGRLLSTPQLSTWRAHLPRLCLAASLPGVSVACARVSARTQYL